MSIKSITSLFLAVCALSAPMANGDTPDYIVIDKDTNVSDLTNPASDEQEFRLMNGITLTVDETTAFDTAFRCYGDTITSTIAFTASGSNGEDPVLTTLSATSFWAGYQGKTEDQNTTIQITVDDAGAKAIRAVATEGGIYMQDIITRSYANYGGVFECSGSGHWSKFALTGTLGWTVINPEVQDESYISSMKDGEIALIGYDRCYYYDGVPSTEQPTPYDYVSYSKLAIVAKGTPEPATATLSLLALAALCARRRRVA